MENSVVIIIPIYKTLGKSELQSIASLNKIKLSQPLKVFLMGSQNMVVSNLSQIQSVLNNRVKVMTSFFKASYFKSIISYNQLLLSRTFYQRFKRYTYMLIFQTDAWIISDRLDEFLTKDITYIGAPWLEADVPEKIGLSVGNGGFSLRHIPRFRDILQKNTVIPDFLWRLYNPVVPLKRRIFKIMIYWPFQWISFLFKYSFYFEKAKYNWMNEDIVWSRFIQDFTSYSLPSIDDALLFSFETNPQKCFQLNNNQLPFGCHARERYDYAFWQTQLKDLDHE